METCFHYSSKTDSTAAASSAQYRGGENNNLPTMTACDMRLTLLIMQRLPSSQTFNEVSFQEFLETSDPGAAARAQYGGARSE